MNPDINEADLAHALNAIIEAELSGVVRYTHYSLMITGPHRLPPVSYTHLRAHET